MAEGNIDIIPTYDTPRGPGDLEKFNIELEKAQIEGFTEFRVLKMGQRADEAHTSFDSQVDVDQKVIFEWIEKDSGEGMEGGSTMDTRKALVAKKPINQ